MNIEILPERIKGKITKTETCWLWVGERTTKGYGRIHLENRSSPAHRYVYELLVGEIPAGLQLDHLCRVRNCVNPKHLEAVTAQENILRGTGVAAINASKTHCVRGHPFSGDNLVYKYSKRMKRTYRMCHECVNWWGREMTRRKKLKRSIA